MSSRKLVVRVVPFQPHCFAFGGFEVQMLAAMESTRAVGADIAPLDFWGRSVDFDVLHFWGLDLQHINTIKWASAAGKKIVVSALVNYPSWRSRMRHWISLAAGPARLRSMMLKSIDCITVVNKEQSRYLIDIAGFPSEKIAVIPNLVEDIFFKNRDETETKESAGSRYVLCVGNICARKNQLFLIKACRKLGVPLLLVGDILTGEENYAKAVAEAISTSEDFLWKRGLTPGSTELANAYHYSSVFALLSYEEKQPISALEAAAGGKPLVLADRPYAKQEFYNHASLANPRSVDDIAVAIRKALDAPSAHCSSPEVIEQCRREKIGRAYLAIYQRLIKGRLLG